MKAKLKNIIDAIIVWGAVVLVLAFVVGLVIGGYALEAYFHSLAIKWGIGK